jgi:type II secretory pathway pseudopilin PulG
MATPRLRRNGGFTYLSVIILVAIIGLVTAATLKMGAVIQRSKAEEQLLDIGAAFSDALQSYADATPAGMPTQPPSLQALLKDTRFTSTRRHLRQIYPDPMTGKAEWGVVYLGDKAGVLAVYSLSDAKPVKIGNFPLRFAGFEGKQKISEWRFAATGKPGGPGSANAAPVTPAAPGTAPPAAMPGLTPPVQVESPAPPAEPAPLAEQPAPELPAEDTKTD